MGCSMSKYSSIFSVLLEIDKTEIPIFIPTFNQPSLLKMTLEQLGGGGNRIVVHDNNSQFDPMRDYLESISSDVDVVFSKINAGPRLFTEDEKILSLMPDYFYVTDPDLIHNDLLPENFQSEMIDVLKAHDLAKVGTALDVYDKDEQEKFVDISSVLEWESLYWTELIGQTSTGDDIYRAYIDTTYSLNDRDKCIMYQLRGYPTFRYSSARIAGNYTAKHVGWWKKELVPQATDEIEFYLNTQQWSHTENYYYRDLKR